MIDILKYIDEMQVMYGDKDPSSMDQEPRIPFGDGLSVDPERDSFKKISNVIGAYNRYRRGEKNPALNFNQFFELYSAENFADGGSAGQLVQNTVDGSRPGYNGNIGQQKVSKEVSESSKKINKNINKWATNWFNKNQKNYGVRDFEKMKNDFTNAWSTELTENLKKYEGYGSAKKTLKMSDSGLPIIKDGISIDGIKFVTRADRAGNNPDLAWERLFYKNKLKNKDFKTQLKQYVEWATANKRKNPNLLDPNVKFGSAAQSKTGTLEYGKKFKGFNDDVIFFMGDVLNKKALNPGGTIKGVTDVFKETLGKDADNYFKKFKGSWNVWVDNFRAVGKLAGLDDSMIDALLKKQTSDTQKIMKLYNVENLPLEFKVAQDHLFGLAEAKALGDPKIASQTLKNLVASTREQNRVLGQEGFSNKRISLIKKFKSANLENKANIINQLNTLADEYVPGRLKYNIKKDGSLKITNLQPETTLKAKASAYENITKTFPKNIQTDISTPEGRLNIKKQQASVTFQKFLKDKGIVVPGCGRQKVVTGGRITFSNGTCGGFKNADEFAKGDPENFLKTIQADSKAAKAINNADASVMKSAFNWAKKDIKRPTGWLGGDIAISTLFTAGGLEQGQTPLEALDQGLLWFLPEKILNSYKKGLTEGMNEQDTAYIKKALDLETVDKNYFTNKNELDSFEKQLKDNPKLFDQVTSQQIKNNRERLTKNIEDSFNYGSQLYEGFGDFERTGKGSDLPYIEGVTSNAPTDKNFEDGYTNAMNKLFEAKKQKAVTGSNISKQYDLGREYQKYLNDIIMPDFIEKGLGKTKEGLLPGKPILDRNYQDYDILGDKSSVFTDYTPSLTRPFAPVTATIGRLAGNYANTKLPFSSNVKRYLENIAVSRGKENLTIPTTMDNLTQQDFDILNQYQSGIKRDYAGGGIAGLSGGDPEGAMTKSMNPDSQGLRSLFNNGKKR